MSDRIRRSYSELLDRAPEPPTWPEITSTRPQTPIPTRRRGPLMALAAAIAAFVVVGAAVGILRGTTTFLAPATVDHTRIEWSQTVEARCLGMEIEDTGGFDRATIDVWGDPSADDRYRVDFTAPDGTVERLIVEMGDDGTTERMWSTHASFAEGVPFVEASAFRSVSCVTNGGRSSFGLVDPPYHPSSGFFWPELIAPVDLGGLRAQYPDLEGLRTSSTDIRTDTWRGRQVTVYVIEDSSTNEAGERIIRWERWVDEATGRYERLVLRSDSETLGGVVTALGVVEREVVPGADVDFSTEGLIETFDIDDLIQDGEPASTTTSILAIDHPLMDDAVEAGEETILTQALREVIDPREGDRIYAVPVGDRQLFVRLRTGVPAHMYATSCNLLVSVELPAGWEGTCLELVRDGRLETGRFSYAAARDLLTDPG